MIFRPRQKSVPNRRTIMLENNAIKLLENNNILRVYINQHLTRKTHRNFIAAKTSKSVGFIRYKAKYCLPSKSLQLHYITHLFISLSHLLQFNLGFYLCHQPAKNLTTPETSCQHHFKSCF